ncbi:MAG: TPR domain-containing protein [Treponema sp.]
MQTQKQALFYIKIPEEYALSSKIPGFDASIPLPLLLPEGEEESPAKDISEEMILAGMLRIFAYQRDNQHIAYYRDIFTALRPDIRSEMTNAAILKIKNGDFEFAEELLFALEGLFPDDMRIKLNVALLLDERALFYEQSGAEDYAEYYTDKAFETYKIVLAAEPALPEAFFNAAFFFIRQKNYQKAKDLFETYIHIETKCSDTITVRKEKAQRLIDWITSQALDDELFKTAFDFIRMEQEEKALESIRQFLEHHPKVWNGWFLLGWALRRLERWEDSKSAFLQCLELGKNQPEEIAAAYCDICNELALCCTELNSFEESKKWLLSALEQEPENIKIISNLGMTALKQGEKEDAKSYFRIVLDINPEDVIAADILKKLDPAE